MSLYPDNGLSSGREPPPNIWGILAIIAFFLTIMAVSGCSTTTITAPEEPYEGCQWSMGYVNSDSIPHYGWMCPKPEEG